MHSWQSWFTVWSGVTVEPHTTLNLQVQHPQCPQPYQQHCPSLLLLDHVRLTVCEPISCFQAPQRNRNKGHGESWEGELLSVYQPREDKSSLVLSLPTASRHLHLLLRYDVFLKGLRGPELLSQLHCCSKDSYQSNDSFKSPNKTPISGELRNASILVLNLCNGQLGFLTTDFHSFTCQALCPSAWAVRTASQCKADPPPESLTCWTMEELGPRGIMGKAEVGTWHLLRWNTNLTHSIYSACIMWKTSVGCCGKGKALQQVVPRFWNFHFL